MSSPNEPGYPRAGDRPGSSNGSGTGAAGADGASAAGKAGGVQARPAGGQITETGEAPPWQRGTARTTPPAPNETRDEGARPASAHSPVSRPGCNASSPARRTRKPSSRLGRQDRRPPRRSLDPAVSRRGRRLTPARSRTCPVRLRAQRRASPPPTLPPQDLRATVRPRGSRWPAELRTRGRSGPACRSAGSTRGLC